MSSGFSPYIGGLLAVLFASECAAFGILFTSPEQRQKLDAQREKGTLFEPSGHETAAPIYRTESDRLFFNGYVLRKSGPGTAWVNNQMLDENNDLVNGSNFYRGATNSDVSVNLKSVTKTAVPIKPAPEMPAVKLQPGQSLLLQTGQVLENYTTQNSAVIFELNSMSPKTNFTRNSKSVPKENSNKALEAADSLDQQ